jgi:quercetin dioxygenase-like cupin family protein
MTTRESSTAQTQRTSQPSSESDGETITPLRDLTTTTAGEPLLYLSTPNPVISSAILSIAPGGISRWMVHPVPAYVYILEGDLTVEFIDRKSQTFHEGEVILQPRAVWHRGRNDGKRPLRFLAAFLGAEGVPGIVRPPATR